MNQQSIAADQTTLEDVRHLFEQWREVRKHRTPIPDSLWAKAVSLSADHPIHKISKTLRLNHTDLTRRVCLSRKEALPKPVTSSHAFIEVDVKTSSMTGADYIIEMEDGNGSKMKMHIKGNTGLDPLGLIREFWNKGL
ncbi:MAG: hypothetical protein KBA28_12265 [Syntrophaceae bacterium]|nr:hypothetical protein [Syntrophaceae bacterium]